MFYHVMNDYTPQLHQFYRQESCLMVHEVADEGQSWTVSANGQEDIHHVLDTLYNDVTVKVEAHCSQHSIDGSVLLLVSGRMRRQVCEEDRFFNQAFLLARQPNGFYIHTDNIIVHGVAASSLFLAKWRKRSTEREEPELSRVTEVAPVHEEPAELVDTVTFSSEQEHPVVKEADAVKPSYMEALLKTSTERHAAKQSQRRQSGSCQQLTDSREATRRTAAKMDRAVQKDEQVNERPRGKGETGNKKAKRETRKEEDSKRLANSSRQRRGTAGRNLGSAQTRNGAREGTRWQARGTNGLGGSKSAKEDDGRKWAQPRAQGYSRDRADQLGQSQTKGRPRTAKTRDAEDEELYNRRIFVAKLPLGVTRESVEEAFKAFGDIETVVVRAGGKTAFAFITYQTKGSASEALAQADVVVNGKMAIAKKWIDNPQREISRHVERRT